MLPRQPDDQLIAKDGQPVIRVGARLCAKAAVDRPLTQPAGHLQVAALLHPHRHARIAGAKGRQDLRHPQRGNAVVAADAQRACDRAADLRAELLGVAVRTHDLAQQRQHELAVFRELHALLAAQKERESKLLLQRADHARDARLRVAQKPRRRGQAPLLGRGQKSLAFDSFHRALHS